MRMGGISCLRRRRADGDHTHALVAEQSQSFPDNLVALLGSIRAWNCSAENESFAVGVRRLRYMLKSSLLSVARPASDRAPPFAKQERWLVRRRRWSPPSAAVN